jgi:Raf kinase inhibitor-like YbhB/YbcL family protein
LFCCIVVVALAGCVRKSTSTEEEHPMTIQVTSSAFADGSTIPSRYTADGADVSPPLKWSGVPAAAKSLAIICDDPDAPRGTWVHWVAFNLPPTEVEIAEGATTFGGKQGKNDFRKLGYGGPSPPPGKPHRYFFKVFALDTLLDLAEGATKADLEKAMHGHVLASGQLMGKYGR